MFIVRLTVVVLNIVAAVLMGMSAVAILGPDQSDPPRGMMFDFFWVLFHIGPCVAMAVLGSLSKRLGGWGLALALIPISLTIVTPGLLVADYEIHRPRDHSPTHGAATFLVVCMEYIATVVMWAIALGMWWYRRRQPAR